MQARHFGSQSQVHSESQYQVMDVNEQRKKRERERHAQMTDEEKHEKLKKRCEAYHQNKTKKLEGREKGCTEEEKQEILKKRREAYQQRKSKEAEETKISCTEEEKQDILKKRHEAYQQIKTKEPEQMKKKCAQDRQRYANMESEQRKARIDQITSNKILKRSTPCKDSIAMENPAYITTEEEIGTSNLNARQRKPVTPGERQTLLQRRNEEFSEKRRKTVSKLSEKDTSEMNNDNNDIEPIKHPQVMIKGNMIYFILYRHIKKQYILYTTNHV